MRRDGRLVGAWRRAGTVLLALAAVGGAALCGCGKDDPVRPVDSRSTPGVLYDVAGRAGSAGYTGNGGPAVSARLYYPQDMVVSGGDLYVVDWNNHVIRKVDAAGVITRAIGSGVHGDDSDGPALEVNLNHPDNIAIGPTGDFYICGWHNWKIKKVDHNTFMVSSPVGTDDGFEGDGGPATSARISLPSSVVWDDAGNMYVTDQGNTRIRMIDAQGLIWTFAGGDKGYADGAGETARFAWPTGTDSYPGGKMDIAGNGEEFFLADTENHRIRKIRIASRMVTTIAGTGAAGYSGDGAAAMAAQFNEPTDIACTPRGDIFVADAGNHVVRRIDASGAITTVAGTGVSGVSPDGTVATVARLNRPSGIYWDEPTRTLFIADTFNHQVKRVTLPN
jgi:hypothetical protein